MSARTFMFKSLVVILQLSMVFPAYADLMKISDFPLDTKLATTNIIMPLDDSNSMDWEILLKNITVNGNPEIYNNGVKQDNKGHDITHIFPPSTNNNDGAHSFDKTAAPSNANAYYRSSDYNLIYYNPRIDYDPWRSGFLYSDATKKSSLWVFPEASTKAARYHPYFTKDSNGESCSNTNQCSTIDLTAEKTSNFTADNGIYVDKNYSYWPATYWLLDATCSASDTANCSVAPDGKTLRKYDIQNSSIFNGSSFTLPDGKTTIYRSRSDELQNFANWFTYYRKRKLLLAGGMGNVLNNLQASYTNMRVAMVKFSETFDLSTTDFVSTKGLTLYDFKSSDNALNGYSAIGKLYSLETQAQYGTTTNSAVEYAGQRYVNDSAFGDENTLRCSKNNNFVLTDGYANDYSLEQRDWRGDVTIVSRNKTLYSRALSYYDQLDWWYKFNTANQSNLGYTMNTYAVTLGAYGKLFDGSTPVAPLSPEPAWNSSVPANNSPSAIDDLWRAASRTGGKMLAASDPSVLTNSITSILREMFVTTSHSNVPVSEKYLTNNSTAIVTSFNTGDWTSDIKSHPVYNNASDVANIGKINTSVTNWSAKELLDKRDISTRRIVTYNADLSVKAGIPFTTDSLKNSKLIDTFNTSASKKDGEDVVSYLRGNRTKEGTNYNSRGGVLGDIVNSSPLFVTGGLTAYSDLTYQQFAYKQNSRKKMIYVGANDGMMHAFNADTGVEEWAYVPQMLHSKLNAANEYVRLNYQHKFYVDGPLTAWDVKFSDNQWHTLLVGGLRAGGKGYYALEITTPPGETDKEADIAKNVKWEFTHANMGYSYGKPVIVNTKSYGWVVLLTSGYNNADGKAHLFVVNAETGALIKDISTADFGFADGSTSDPLGMAQVSYLPMSAPEVDTTGLVRYAYAGDLKGNVWKFDLSSNDKANWKVSKFAEKLSLDGTGRPITTAPAIGFINTKGSPNPINSDPLGGQLAVDTKDKRLMIYVGTGKFLHQDDFTEANANLKQNGFFAMEDFLATSSEPNDTAEKAFVYGKAPCSNLGCLKKVGLPDAPAKSEGFNNWAAENESGLTKWWISGQYDKTTYCAAGESCSGFSFKDSSSRQRSGRGWYLGFSDTGNESVIQNPIAEYGFVTFVTTMKTDWRHGAQGSCENAYSAEFVLGGTKGGQLPASDFIDGVAWSRKNLGYGIASYQTLVVGADGWVRAIVNTGGKTTTSTLPAKDTPNCTLTNTCIPPECTVSGTCSPNPPPASGTLRRWGWKEVYR